MPSPDPILVVGGRTTGLTMACELARHGVPVRIVDECAGIDPHVRATVVHSRTLEIFHDLGIVDEVVRAGVKLRGFNQYANGKRFLHARYGDVDSPFPWGISLGQCVTEAILERLLGSLGVAVERGTRLVAMTQQPAGVRATLRRADGREEILDTPWLVGCDGAHSLVRQSIAEGFPGEADPHRYALADVIVDVPLDHDEVHVFLTERGALFFFLLPEGRFMVAADVPEGHPAAPDAPTLEDIQALVTERGPAGARVRDPRWLTYFHIHYRLTPHYRRGRAFLAGDAAHVHSLVGGQGMNTGIQDAHNLAWKLALVVRGRAPESLLDTYETERRDVARDVLELTRRQTDEMVEFPHLSPAARAKLCAHAVVPDAARLSQARHTEELDLDYRKSPICAEHVASGPGAADCGAGPHPGAQARDGGPLDVAGRTTTLFELLRGTRHTLLLFTGAAPDPSACDHLAELAGAVAASHGDLMQACLVVAGDAPQPTAPPAVVTLVRDPERALHRRYGADAACLYLIRPDGYVGYRSRRPTPSALREYLARVFALAPAG